jgi:hypothetical protein
MTTRNNHESEPEPSLHDFFFNLRTLEPQLRILTAVVSAQVIAAAVLLALRELPPSHVSLRWDKWLGAATVPIPQYLVSCAFVFVGIGLFMTGLLQADRRGAIRVLWLMVIAYVLIIVGEGARAGVYIITTLTVLALWALSITFVQTYLRRAGSQQTVVLRTVTWVYFVVAFGFTSYMTVYLLMEDATVFGTVLLWLRAPTAALLLLAGVDWAEIADTIVRAPANSASLRQRPTLLTLASIMTVAVVLLATVYAISRVGSGFAWIFASDLAVVAAILVLLRIARFQGTWAVHFPWTSLVVTIGVVDLARITMIQLLSPFHYAILLTAVAAALLCVSGRRAGMDWLAPTMLFGVFAGMIAALANQSSTGEIIPDVRQLGSAYLMASIDATIATFALLGWIAANSRTVDWRTPLRILLTFNCSLGLIFLLAGSYAAGLHAAESLIVIDALIFLVAILWDILASGHSITNIESVWFPRRSRLLLFFSFISLTLACVVFFGSMDGPHENLHKFRLALNPDLAVLYGLTLFAPAMLCALFVLRVGKWLAEERIFAGHPEQSS